MRYDLFLELLLGNLAFFLRPMFLGELLLLFLQVLNLSSALHQVSFLILGLFLKIIDVAELVHGEDVVVGRAHIVLEVDAVLHIVGQITFGL